MNKQEQNRTIHRVISVFGAKNQKMQTIEELIELQKEIFENVHRETNNRQNILEEVIYTISLSMNNIYDNLETVSFYVNNEEVYTINISDIK